MTADQPRADAIAAPYSPVEAIAIVTSVSPGSSGTMHEAMAAAPDAIEHLRSLGYVLATLAPADPTADLRAALDGALGRLGVLDLYYDHPVAMSGEPMDPILFVRYEAIRAALAASTTEDGS